MLNQDDLTQFIRGNDDNDTLFRRERKVCGDMRIVAKIQHETICCRIFNDSCLIFKVKTNNFIFNYLIN